MKMRMPLIPLFTIDPYFSVWSKDKINCVMPEHWTGSPNSMIGTVTVDGEEYRFLGAGKAPVIEQTDISADALSTVVFYRNEKIELKAVFTSPVMADDLYYTSRPVTYLKISYKSLDGNPHKVTAKLSVSEQLVLNLAGEGRALSDIVEIKNGSCIRMGNGVQNVLWRSGDMVRIDWGYFYLAANKKAKVGAEVAEQLYSVYAEAELRDDVLFALAYDDIDSLVYFNEPVKAYWKKDGKTIAQAIDEAISEYDSLYKRCCDFANTLTEKATKVGGFKYAELLSLAYRQVMAAHKLAVDKEGNNIYISKECSSNGCAATVDVTYPSAPMYLHFNTELLKGMLRPIMRYSTSEEWTFDFAPHDVGQYPLLNGQFYISGACGDHMPVEECGNMLILMAAISKADGNVNFAKEYIRELKQWNKYLVKYGLDPDEQLCTDDFAGRLSHNCNLSIKAIMGMAGFAYILGELGITQEAEELMKLVREYAESFEKRAKNSDGSYRLAYDKPDTFSLKYNAVWDKVWKTDVFSEEFYIGELNRYKKEALPYGIPLDSREKYTKSDWLSWVACFSEKEFEDIISLLWSAFNTTRDRVPMTDWYFADTAQYRIFKHRSSIGGLFIRLLID